jgi:hypothetical protein
MRGANLQVAPARQAAPWTRTVVTQGPPQGTPGCSEVSLGLYASSRVFPMCCPGPQALIPTLSDVMGGVSGGVHPTSYRQLRDLGKEAPSILVIGPSESTPP